METISKAIWGEGKSGEEPVSGKQGAGTTNEPFDKGNDESTKDTTTGPSSGNKPPSAGVDTNASARDGPSEATSSDAAGDPTSGQKPSVKQQGAGNPGDEPKKEGKPGVPHTDEEREKAMETGEFPHDPNDHSGEPLKMHGGAEKTEESSEEPGSGAKKDRSASVSQEGGNPHGKELGTGEKVVKASGLAADGGDFDATKPGAGSEATRLLEEKGIVHKTTPDKTAEATEGKTASASTDSPKTKQSKLDKLKEKLHIKK